MKFSIKEEFGFAFKNFPENGKVWLPLIITEFAIQFLFRMYPVTSKSLVVLIPLGVFGFLLNIYFIFLGERFSLINSNDKKVHQSDMIPSFKLGLNFILATLLYWLTSVPALIAFTISTFLITTKIYLYAFVVGGIIVPVTILAFTVIVFGFTGLIVIDKRVGPIEALRISYRITRGSRKRLCLFYLMALLVAIGGFLIFIFGLLVAIPVIFIARARVYRKLMASYEIQNKLAFSEI